MHDPYRSGRYAVKHPDWHEEDAPEKARAVAELIRFGGLAPKVVIDVGCGSGGVLYHLSRSLGPRLPETHWEGWDISPEAIRRARQREGGQLHYVCGDLLDSERRADLILALDVVEHVPDDVGFLRALRQRADHFVFRIPLDLSVWDVARPGPRLNRVGPHFGHWHLYTRELALQRLVEAGYHVASERYHRARPLSGRVTDRIRGRWMRHAPHAAVRWLGGFSLLVLADA